MKKILFLLLIVAMYSCAPDSEQYTYKLSEDVISFGNDFTITSNKNENKGKVIEKVFNFTTTFEYFDENGNLIARAEEAMFNLVTKINIYDNNNKLIGCIEYEIFENVLSLENTYSIKDSNGNVIAKSRKLDFGTSNVDIYDTNQSKKFAKIYRPFINMITDTWYVQIHSDIIDHRILMFIPCYKTSADNKKKEKKAH